MCVSFPDDGCYGCHIYNSPQNHVYRVTIRVGPEGSAQQNLNLNPDKNW